MHKDRYKTPGDMNNQEKMASPKDYYKLPITELKNPGGKTEYPTTAENF